MASDELLTQIKKLFEQERVETRKLVREEVGLVEKRLTEEITKVQEKLEAKIDKVQETVDIVQSVMVEHHSKLAERITTIERDLHPSKN